MRSGTEIKGEKKVEGTYETSYVHSGRKKKAAAATAAAAAPAAAPPPPAAVATPAAVVATPAAAAVAAVVALELEPAALVTWHGQRVWLVQKWVVGARKQGASI